MTVGGRHIYLWEPELSPHKLPLFRALRAHPAVESVKYIYDAEIGAARRDLGWGTAVGVDEDVVWARERSQVAALVQQSPAECVHVFSGMHWVPGIVEGIRQCVRLGRRFGILHEPRVLEGWKGKLRLGHSWLTEGPLRRHANFVLAIGAHGPRWFRLSGFGGERIFPFAYFLPVSNAHAARGRLPRVGFVGRHEAAKGFGLFLEALERIKAPIEAHVVGRGSLSDAGRERLKGAGVWHGVVPIGQMPALMAQFDVLVLPSTTTDDGWGAVVSEALMSGVAVVCSDRVGASMCLADQRFGRVVRELKADALASAVDDLLEPAMLAEGIRAARREWAAARLSAEAGADYLLSILRHVYEGDARPRSFVA